MFNIRIQISSFYLLINFYNRNCGSFAITAQYFRIFIKYMKNWRNLFTALFLKAIFIIDITK